jgi:hypothetical protein
MTSALINYIMSECKLQTYILQFEKISNRCSKFFNSVRRLQFALKKIKLMCINIQQIPFHLKLKYCMICSEFGNFVIIILSYTYVILSRQNWQWTLRYWCQAWSFNSETLNFEKRLISIMSIFVTCFKLILGSSIM